ncbi:MAG: hypothetical protein JSV21_10190 [Nitrospirota bacterium]|nr:MAG: hypothetical protein JSV21_10190 [Nitrospirota bacterium]
MKTLFDFITHVKGIEYLIAVSSIILFIVMWEVLKKKPFGEMRTTLNDDVAYLKDEGRSGVMKKTGRLIAAPFIGIAYVVALPFAFLFALSMGIWSLITKAIGGALNLVGLGSSFEWRPTEAYLAGKKKKGSEESQNLEDSEE